MIRSKRSGRLRSGRAQAVAEFALVLPVFLLILFGVIDGARLVFTNSQLSQAAREGARVASVEVSWVGSTDPACATALEIATTRPGGHVCPADPAALKADVVAAVNRMAIGLDTISIVWLACDSGDVGDAAPTDAWTESTVTFPQCGPDTGGDRPPTNQGSLVSVRIEYTYRTLTPILSSILGTIPLSGSATMVIN